MENLFTQPEAYAVTFDQFQRYATAAKCIEAIRQENSTVTYQILELGANEHKNLKRFLPNDTITFSDVTLSLQMKQDPNFIQADGTNLPFADNAYDFIIALDVLEHIPYEKREPFLKEMNRVARKGAIICFPFASEETTEAETRINTYFKAIQGKDYIWLEEHLNNGLPTTLEVETLLTQCNVKYLNLFHGNLYLWEKLLVSHLNTVFHGALQTYHSCIDSFYNKHLYCGDIAEPFYRVFYFCCKDVVQISTVQDALHKLLQPIENQCMYLEQMDALLHMQEQIVLPESTIQLQKAIDDKEQHIQNITAQLADKEQHIQNITAQLAQTEKSKEVIYILEQKIESCEQEHKIFIQEITRQHQSAHNELQASLNQQLLLTHSAITEKNKLKSNLDYYKLHYYAAINQRNDLQGQLIQAAQRYDTIANAACWKMTKPLRVFLDGLKKLLKSNRFTHLICKGLKSIKQNGVKVTWKKARNKFTRRKAVNAATRPLYTKAELETQKTQIFDKKIKFSIVVPLYNTPEKFLGEMIQSVLDQTYANWELCMADGSDAGHRKVEAICKEYVRKDKRILYKKLSKNLGISENTNACIDMSTGEYVALFDHDDVLHPAALFEVMKAICEQNADFIYCDEDKFTLLNKPHFDPYYKPDFAIDTLRANNYICHFTVFAKPLLLQTGLFNATFDGSQDHDMILRLTEVAQYIVHIPHILYHWRVSSNSVASDPYSKTYAIAAGQNAVAEHLKRVGLDGTVSSTTAHPNIYRIEYAIKNNPLISIIIPTKDHVDDLKRCITSILKKTSYGRYEIIILENNSTQKQTFSYYKTLENNQNIKVLTYEETGFNYSKLNNYASTFACGEHLVFLNNDTEVISENWLQEMLMFSQRSDVGAVGAMLYYPNDTIQHAGLAIGLLTLAGHVFRHFPRTTTGYFGNTCYARNVSAVTAACLMMRTAVFEQIGGFDSAFAVAFNDVDLCMRIRQQGYLICWTPYAELYHYESLSRGTEDTPEKQKRFSGEVARFQERWAKELQQGDPYYNPNLTLEKEDFSIKE